MQNGELDGSDRRQCTLNMILYDSLREDCGTTMVFCIHPDRRFALSARSTLQMALRCRRIVRQKRVRRLELAGYYTELADLRIAASALSSAHKQALQARLSKEEELQRTSQQLQELRERYEEKTRDFEALRSNLESRYDRLDEDNEKQQLMVDLERKNELMQLMREQLQCLEGQIAEKDELHARRENEYMELQQMYEEAAIRSASKRLEVSVVDAARLSRAAAAEGLEDRCQELEDQLRMMKEAHEKELRDLKETIQQQATAAEAFS